MKTCKKCRYFSYTIGDMDTREYPDGGDWGFCCAPIPMHIEEFCGEVQASDNASDCDAYKKIKKVKND